MKKLKLNSKKILAILFAFVVTFFFATIIERYVRYSLLHQNPNYIIAAENNEEGSDAGSVFKELFPVEEKDDEAEDEKQPVNVTVKEPSFYQKASEHINNVENSIDYYTEKLLFLRMKFIDLNSYFNKLIGMKIFTDTDNHVITMLDGNLTFEPRYQDMTESANSVAEFAKEIESSGTKFLFVQAPAKVDENNNLLPNGVEDYDNQKANQMLSILKKEGVDYLDLRELMHEQNIDFSDAFFKTDHHWKIDTALWATGEIANHIQQKNYIKIETSKFNIDEYTKKVFKDSNLGSLGKIVTLAYADPEDMEVYLPKFKTDYTMRDFGWDITKSGTFEETLIDMKVLDKTDYYNVSTYSAYMHNVSALACIENHLAQNDSSVLVIGDSFIDSVIPYLSVGVNKAYYMGINFDGSIKTFIKEYRPQLVVMLVYPSIWESSLNVFLNYGK